MRALTLILLALALSATAYAATLSTSNVFQYAQKPWGRGAGSGDGVRIRGDTVAEPFIVDVFPFSATGSTCSFNHDYDYACPYAGSTAKDVVYKYTCIISQRVNIDLCQSTYDTKVYVFEDTVDNVIACNDDHCSWQSQLACVPFSVGHTYYVIIDGYGSSCGDYVLAVEPFVPCVIECPPDATPEGEPDCYDGYNDTYNSGCNATPFPVFQIIEPGPDSPTVICGTTGVFTYGTVLYRDTDWFELCPVAIYGTICLAGDAEVPTYFFIIDGNYGCSGLSIVAYGLAGPCAPVGDICWDTGWSGTWWVWAGAAAFDPYYACGSKYRLEIWGYGPYSPTIDTTWGSVKELFR
jgi:hypothetical protein